MIPISKSTNAATILVFIHGLGTHFYEAWGQKDYPGAFITRIAVDLPEVSISAFAYPSQFSHFLRNPKLSMDAICREWSHTLGDLLTSYHNVVVVSHCLGGLITNEALRQIFSTSRAATAHIESRNLVLFHLDSPNSIPRSGPSVWLAGILETIRLSRRTVDDSAAFWKSQLVPVARISPNFSVSAVVSNSESWVTPHDTRASIPEIDICEVDIAHEDVSRAPESGKFIPYDFVLNRIRRFLSDFPCSP